jgi:hypothetical protein
MNSSNEVQTYVTGIAPQTFINAFDIFIVYRWTGPAPSPVGDLCLFARDGFTRDTTNTIQDKNNEYIYVTPDMVGGDALYNIDNPFTSIYNVKLNQTTKLLSSYINGSNTTLALGGQTFDAYDGGSIFGIGGHPSGDIGFNCVLNEVLLFNVELSTIQRQQVEGYLASKWGLQTSIVPTNPYYNYNIWPQVTSLIGPTGPPVGVTLQRGSTTTNGSGIANVGFSPHFATTPYVTVTISDGSQGFIVADLIDDKGFRARAWDTEGHLSVSFSWIAVL